MKNNLTKLTRLGLILAFLSVGVIANAQTDKLFTIKGHVVDNFTNQVIPGVTVMVKGTTQGTYTDAAGNYSFSVNVPEGTHQIVFSFIGYSTETQDITFGTSAEVTVDAKLSTDVTKMDEVVVTGLSGATKKSQLGNSISTVSRDELGIDRAVSVGGALQGQIAGAQIMQNSGNPAGGISIRLRGASTLSGSSDPLYIVDGVVVNNSSDQLVDLGGYTQNRMVDIDPKDIARIEVLKGSAAAAIYGSRASNGVIQIFTKKGTSGAPKVTFMSSVNMNQIRKKLPYNDAQLKWDGTNAVPATRYNYQDYIFNDAMGYENYISVAGGKNNTTYLFSGSQLSNGGIVKNTDFKRNSLRMRLDQRFTHWASATLSSYVSNNSSHEMPNGKNYGPITSLLFADNLNDPSPVNGVYPNIGWMANPYESVDRIDAPETNFRAINSVKLTLAPIDGLTMNYTLGLDHSNSDAKLYIPVGFNTKVTGVSEKSTKTANFINSDFSMSYTKNLFGHLKSTTGLGYSYEYDDAELFAIRTDHLGPVATVTDVGTVKSRADYRTERAIWGGFLQQTFGYNEKMFLTVAGRFDGASVFGPDERQQFYPKVSGSYLISSENFWKNSLGKYINKLKLRAAWGQAGNLTALKPYDISTSYDLAAINGNTGLVIPYTAGNENARPERQTELELGTDMDFLNGRMGLEFSYYKQDIEDLLVLRSLAPSSGYGQRYENIGTMTNKGVELMLRAEPVRTKNLRWLVTATFSKNNNIVTHVEGGKLDLGMWGTSIAQSGQALGVFYGYYYATDANGKKVLDANGFTQRARGHYEDQTLPDGEVIPVAVQDFDANGQPTGGTLKKIIGDPNPDWVGSLTNTITYKNLSFSFQLDAVQGFNVMSWDKRMFDLFPGGEATAQELRGELDKGASRPNFFIYQSFIEDGSFTKIREVALSYNLNLKKAVKSLKFTLTGSNLYSFDNYYGFDPEVNTEAQSNGVRGQDMANVPIPRVIKFGVTAKF